MKARNGWTAHITDRPEKESDASNANGYHPIINPKTQVRSMNMKRR
jgi:hypothetical protein